MNKLPAQNQINIDYSKKRNLGDILIPEYIKQKKYWNWQIRLMKKMKKAKKHTLDTICKTRI